ncbi:hypothetical protein ACFQ3P_40930 [Paraburkholderia sabiae]|uniref:DUF2384 domain-containing protein n=1 Tax=Paraburkholderia sabiae TaxID=273251 RepID=A0ABU9QM08_9BURK|nr:hypothetical protein [Paraburkholderia sabiae]WJZ77275.1 hypothetical protein QEN71_34950 [Paraburkholderia sabiae]CAD6548242.1 hypothetical protein LMG24235_04549 [Paraburkholderia sabiae]
MLDYENAGAGGIPVFTCDRCGQRVPGDDPGHAEKQSLAWRTGAHSVFGDRKNVRIDLCQHCVRDVLGAWLKISDRPTEDDVRASRSGFNADLLARRWPDSTRVAARLGVSPEEAPAYVYRLRADGLILGVWSSSRDRYVYPDFQFDRAGRPYPVVARLLAILPDGGWHKGGWDRAGWLYWPHRKLGGEKPAEVFAVSPQRVIDLAVEEFRQPRDEAW